MRPPTTQSLLLATLLPKILAQETDNFFSTKTFRSGDASRDIPFDDWTDAFITANATSRVPISGYDLTKPWKPTPLDNWSFTIQVKDDIPHLDGDFITGTWIILNAPEEQVSFNDTKRGNASETVYVIKQDKTWRVCASMWFLAELKSDAEKVNDNCEGLLSEGCLAALNKVVTDRAYCESAPPEECRGEFGESTEGFGRVMEEAIPTTSKGKYNYAQNADTSTLHKLGNTTSYDVALRQVYVTSLKWANADADLSAGSPASLVCLRAGNGVEEGSRGIQPLPVDSSDAVLLAKGLGSFWAMSAVVGVLVLGLLG